MRTNGSWPQKLPSSGQPTIEVDDADIVDEHWVDEDSHVAADDSAGVKVMGVQDQSQVSLDQQTELDLAMACRDMGLHQAAILRFRKMMSVEGLAVHCRTMIGLCLADQGLDRLAISELKNALYLRNITEDQTEALLYELGQIYERIGDRPEALYYFTKLCRRQPRFRDVQRRVEALSRR